MHAFLDFLISHQMGYPTSNSQLDCAACAYIEELVALKLGLETYSPDLAI